MAGPVYPALRPTRLDGTWPGPRELDCQAAIWCAEAEIRRMTIRAQCPAQSSRGRPTRQSLRRSGYGSPAKADSRYGDGASEATRDLLRKCWKRESRSFAEPVPSGRVTRSGESRSLAEPVLS